MFDKLLNLLEVVMGGMSSFFDSLSTDVLTLLEENSNGFTEFLLTVLDGVNLTDYFSGVTLGAFLFGAGIISLIVIMIIYFFIP